MKASTRPSRHLIVILATLTLLGLLPAFLPATLLAWTLLGTVLLVIAMLDYMLPKAPLQAERFNQDILPVGIWTGVRLRIHNTGQRKQTIKLFDHYPQPAEYQNLPQNAVLAANTWSEFRYQLRPLLRGELSFGPVQVLSHSRLGLWQHSQLLGQSQAVKIYPDFAAIAKYALLAHDQRSTAMGIHQRRRRGEGQDFFQLREYHEGDSLRQVDWKATARHRKLISKEYQDERDQRVVFLLDCGRRMRTQDTALSHFDHALNAMILLTYVALRQGDAVGVQSFAGDDRWLQAKKGKAVLNTLINTVYDLQPTLRAPDYEAAAERLLQRQRRRALIVILSNLRDEDGDDLLPAVQLLSRRHLLLIANLREGILDTTLRQPVQNFRQARLYAAVCHYLAAREQSQELLRQHGALVLDSKPEQLPVALINHYLAIKRSGQL